MNGDALWRQCPHFCLHNRVLGRQDQANPGPGPIGALKVIEPASSWAIDDQTVASLSGA